MDKASSASGDTSARRSFERLAQAWWSPLAERCTPAPTEAIVRLAYQSAAAISSEHVHRPPPSIDWRKWDRDTEPRAIARESLWGPLRHYPYVPAIDRALANALGPRQAAVLDLTSYASGPSAHLRRPFPLIISSTDSPIIAERNSRMLQSGRSKEAVILFENLVALPTPSIDGIIAREYLEPGDNMVQRLAQLSRVIHPGGRFAMTSFTSAHPGDAIRSLREVQRSVVADIPSLKRILLNAGFETDTVTDLSVPFKDALLQTVQMSVKTLSDTPPHPTVLGPLYMEIEIARLRLAAINEGELAVTLMAGSRT